MTRSTLDRFPFRGWLALLAGSLLVVLLGPAPALAGSSGTGTWKWRDASGRVVYSDLPPPPGARVSGLAAPGSGASAMSGASAVTPAAPDTPSRTAPVSPGAAADNTLPASTRTAAVPGWVEREKASRRNAQARAEEEQRQAEEKRQAAERERACTDAAADLRTLESGVRMATVNASGAPQVMEAVERARRADKTRRMIEENCGSRG